MIFILICLESQNVVQKKVVQNQSYQKKKRFSIHTEKKSTTTTTKCLKGKIVIEFQFYLKINLFFDLN